MHHKHSFSHRAVKTSEIPEAEAEIVKPTWNYLWQELVCWNSWQRQLGHEVWYRIFHWWLINWLRCRVWTLTRVIFFINGQPPSHIHTQCFRVKSLLLLPLLWLCLCYCTKLFSFATESSVVFECNEFPERNLQFLSNINCCITSLVPGQTDKKESEEADTLGNAASSIEHTGPEPALPTRCVIQCKMCNICTCTSI